MSVENDPFDHAIHALYESAVNPEYWKLACERIGAVINGKLLSLTLRDSAQRVFTYNSVPNSGAAYSPKTEFSDREADISLTVLFRADSDSDDESARARLKLFTPHLARAFRLRQSLNREVADQPHAESAALTIDVHGRILRSNMPMKKLLAQNALIGERDGHLCLPDTFRTKIAQDADALRSERRKNAPPYRAVRLSAQSDSGENALYAFYRVIAGNAGIEVRMSFYQPDAAPDVDADLIAGAFDLTRAESRVAAQIAAGRSPKEIAVRLGVQHDTVRKQLQAVYQKTATNRQADLIRLLMHLPPRELALY